MAAERWLDGLVVDGGCGKEDGGWLWMASVGGGVVVARGKRTALTCLYSPLPPSFGTAVRSLKYAENSLDEE